jgi:ribosomal protein S19
MARSSWKFNYINSFLYKSIFLNKFKSIKSFKVFCRSSSIPKTFLKKSFFIHKGSSFVKILFNKYHTSYKTGEFGVTRKPFSFPLKAPKKVKR